MMVATIEIPEGFIRFRYLLWASTAIVAMIAAIVAGNFWLLDFIHVFSSLLWTGIDLFMGFVLGPILRRGPLGSSRNHATPHTAYAFSNADGFHHCRHDGLVPRSQDRLYRT
jgi:hypothetical protein